MHDNPRLAELAARHGVVTEYQDWTGAATRVDEPTLVAVLRALDVDGSTPESIELALADADERPWRRMLPPSLVTREGQSPSFPVHVPHGDAVRVDIVLEDGSVRAAEQLQNWVDPREVDGTFVGRATFQLPGDLPRGWHELRAYVRGAAVPTATATVAVVPQRGGVDRGPIWGLMAQLYQVRSAGSWGVGDLRDASTLAEWGAGHGADFLLLNPLHAPAPVVPVEPSPYLPVTRRFVDPSIVRIDEVIDAGRMPEHVAARLASLGAAAKAGNALDGIDRDAMWRAKRDALGAIFETDLDDRDRQRAFGEFCEREGEGLVDFATYCVLAEQYGRDWHAWPDGLREPVTPAVAAFRDANDGRVDFYRWLQWIVDEQLARVQADARASGMRIGIVHDLAVGVHRHGSDAWSLQDVLAGDVSVGAPPDAFNQLGQDWSQPPWRPDRLAEAGYSPFRDMLRAVFRHAGGVRIDHILGLFRLWWIPNGNSAGQGAYVRYDAEAMLGVLLLEAERAGARVIGEDLGVVEAGTRRTLADRGVSGTSIVWWERDADDRPMDPGEYREACLAAVTTHDLPPTAGYLELAHVELRERLGLLTRSADEEREAERESIDRVLARLEELGMLDPGASVDDRVVALHRFVAMSAANAFGVAVADLARDRRSVNQPGTSDEYPNWSIPLAGSDGAPMSLEELVSSPFAAALAAASTRVRGAVTPAVDETGAGDVPG
ncbi:4-alpha-glucanotransferase [Pseudoclavibacter endophyticus]|uniref:4-alpha-glucanotransferase n=1 Tax=Pseudoclavibacter endophyticus TaxID=1778590 RepID=A0A6H9WLQ0_9MICO|nr:4-alpha-glucanotransferase [Pseudoclavibacter endophyticus]KAB1649756.1 4-alpha-glucanotransferase [Pseudoclavibacter endophyticus]